MSSVFLWHVLSCLVISCDKPSTDLTKRESMQMFEQLRAVTLATQDLSVSHSNARARMVQHAVPFPPRLTVS